LKTQLSEQRWQARVEKDHQRLAVIEAQVRSGLRAALGCGWVKDGKSGTSIE